MGKKEMLEKVGGCFLQYINYNTPLRKDMEKKFITDELIKVANALDEMGLTKEANSLDKIARKVISQTTAPEPEGDYAKDIQTYKKLLLENTDQTIARDFSVKVLKSDLLTAEQEIAWSAQTERINTLSKLSPEVRSQINEELYKKVKNHGLEDSDIDIDEFERRWEKSQLGKKQNSPSLDTYNMLRAKFKDSKV